MKCKSKKFCNNRMKERCVTFSAQRFCYLGSNVNHDRRRLCIPLLATHTPAGWRIGLVTYLQKRPVKPT